jgi:hypothetical protein
MKERYEIGFESDGKVKGWIDCHTNTKLEAFKLARKLVSDNPKSKIYVFDKLAHRNRVNLWTFVNGEIKSRIERR